MKSKILFAAMMGVVTTGIISFTLISINIGFVINFIPLWLKSWAAAYVVAIPVILILAPRIQQLTDRILAGKKDTKNQINEESSNNGIRSDYTLGELSERVLE